MESHFKLPERPVTTLALDSTKGMGFQMVRHCLGRCMRHDHTAMKAGTLEFTVFRKRSRSSKLTRAVSVTANELYNDSYKGRSSSSPFFLSASHFSFHGFVHFQHVLQQFLNSISHFTLFHR